LCADAPFPIRQWIGDFVAKKVDAAAGSIVTALLDRHQQDALYSNEIVRAVGIPTSEVKALSTPLNSLQA